MSAGVLIYCFDSEKVKYHTVANFCISQIKKHLNLPVTVVTNASTEKFLKNNNSTVIVENKTGNKRIYKNEVVDWFNLERAKSYEYTPYDTTILLDADYFVYTNNLLQFIDTGYDFLLHNKVHDLTGRTSFEYTSFSMLPIVWATVTIFKKNTTTEKIFRLIQHIQNNYSYFCNLYRIDFKNFRNDYAFAIAMHQLNINDYIPSKMSMLTTDTNILEINESGIKFQYADCIGMVKHHDVHVLNKEIPLNV
jgi:hypothetical protein